MGKRTEAFLDSIDTFLSWLSAGLKQTTESYCQVETADSPTVLVAYDGSLISVLEVQGVMGLIGSAEFDQLREGINLTLHTAMSRSGHAIQVYFDYEPDQVIELINHIYEPAKFTSQRLKLDLEDLFRERVNYLSTYCAQEKVYFVLWTRPNVLTSEQFRQASKAKIKAIREEKIPPFIRSQNLMSAYPELRDVHDAFVRSVASDFQRLNILSNVLEVHDAVHAMRMSADPDFTSPQWRPALPGDKLPVREVNKFKGDISDLLWPPLYKQILPREAENIDFRTARIGDRIYSTVFIDLFPRDIKPFVTLFTRAIPTRIPWRISFLAESEGLETIRLKGLFSGILSFSSAHNRLISDSTNLLKYLRINTDEAVVRLRVSAATWAPEGNIPLLRRRTSELVKAIQGWGTTEVSESCGDAFAGVVSSMLGVTTDSMATPSVAPLSDVVYMLPITRPASLWKQGALLFRSADGKPWPFQPGSTEQTTWIDLVYARPGSGKSVLSNAINLALCLSAGIQRLPRIAIIDIGPSSSGLISLIREALPPEMQYQVAYHRLQMTPDYSINPFDTQLGCRYPTPIERAFLVNFLTLLATPIGADRPYDAIADLAGMVVDELYKNLADDGNPYIYAQGVEDIVDGILEAIGFVGDSKTTWWEVTDSLFMAGFTHEATLAQRYAVPLLADASSICRTAAVEDLYGKVIAPTGEPLIHAFGRMISSAVREYPILSRVTSFDLGEARIVSLDLDEVAKSGGDVADRQSAVMYMVARYVLARHYYLTEQILETMPEAYRDYHRVRIQEIREDPKRIVYDEFHRTSKAKAVREQVILDMREGRKWKVQIALLSQSVDDFDPIMIEFATAIYIMDAGPAQSIEKTSKIFGLSETARVALQTRVHGPREGGATFLAQYATKNGVNMQLLTLTLGPIELWAFNTTAEDVNLRNRLYHSLGPKEARRVLANIFPQGSAAKFIEKRLLEKREEQGFIEEELRQSMIEELVTEILTAHARDPDVKGLV